MRIASIAAWGLAIIGNIILFFGYVNIPYWILIALVVLSLILFIAQTSIEKIPAYGFLVATLLFLNWAFGEWIYRLWEARSLFMDPIIITRIFILIGFIMTVLVIFTYHRHFYSFKRTKGRTREVGKMEIFAPYVEAWDRFIRRFKKDTNDKGDQETIYFTLGKVVEEDE